jgi:hypothetical protein
MEVKILPRGASRGPCGLLRGMRTRWWKSKDATPGRLPCCLREIPDVGDPESKVRLGFGHKTRVKVSS